MGAELGGVLIRLDAPANRLRQPAQPAELAGLVLGPIASLAAERLDQRGVRGEDVVALQRQGLVEDLVGRSKRGTLDGRHGHILASRPSVNVVALLRPDSIAPPMAHTVTLIPGDGTGPELVAATRRVLEATGVEFEWDFQEAGAEVVERHGGNP